MSFPPASSGAAFPWVKRSTLRGRSHEPVLAVRYSPDDQLLVAAHFDGSVIGYDTVSLSHKFELNLTPKEDRERLPVTALAFRASAKPLLLACCSNGLVERYDRRTLEKVSSFTEADNEINACDYAPGGQHFATAGRDAAVRVYDDATCEVVHEFRTAPEYATNVAALRLYSVRFNVQNPNLVAAGGWGNTVHIFDMRAGKEASQLFGPYMTGDCLDSYGGAILTASNRLENRVQMWDTETKEATEVPWPIATSFLPNCARLSPDGDFAAVGGSGGQGLTDGAFVIERRTNKVVVDGGKWGAAVTACAFATRDAQVAFGDAQGHVTVYENRFAKKAAAAAKAAAAKEGE
jgi:WD40 repeat protein